MATRFDRLALVSEFEVEVVEGEPPERTAGGRGLPLSGNNVVTGCARSLYPAAYLGQPVRLESAAADRHSAALQAFELDLQARNLGDLAGRGISHELFSSVGRGVFTIGPDAGEIQEQEYA